MASGILSGKTALVTGGGSGIGRAIVLRFADEGATVVALDVNDAALTETCRLAGPRCTSQNCDVTDERRLTALIEAMPRLDVLVNNAGVGFAWDAMNGPIEQFQHMIDISMLGPLHGSRAAGRKMSTQKQGRIINVTSIHAGLGEARNAHYDMAKAAVNQLTRTLAVEWAPHNILVNAIAPGYVDTALSRASGENELETDWFKTFYVARRRIPLARAAQPSEIAEAALFLAHPRNTYMTGAVITVDGGLSITF